MSSWLSNGLEVVKSGLLTMVGRVKDEVSSVSSYINVVVWVFILYYLISSGLSIDSSGFFDPLLSINWNLVLFILILYVVDVLLGGGVKSFVNMCFNSFDVSFKKMLENPWQESAYKESAGSVVSSWEKIFNPYTVKFISTVWEVPGSLTASFGMFGLLVIAYPLFVFLVLFCKLMWLAWESFTSLMSFAWESFTSVGKSFTVSVKAWLGNSSR